VKSDDIEKVKSAVRVERFSNLEFQPRFEYGHTAELVEISGMKDGPERVLLL
jgi:hypothetical protein